MSWLRLSLAEAETENPHISGKFIKRAYLLAHKSQLIDLFWLHVTFSKRWWGKNQDFMLMRFSKPSNLIGCGGGHLTNHKLARHMWGGCMHKACGGVHMQGMHGGCMHKACMGVHVQCAHGGCMYNAHVGGACARHM